ncbi:MAG: wax ester/triacylglycerol synthase family O-acyltransferase [Pseudomonadales bacterium]
MQQLDPQHVKFIYQETSTTPMHMAGFGIFDQSTVPGGRLGHKNIINFFEERLHLAPRMRQRLVQVPLDLDRPYWINDPNFDIEFHIRHIALPHPGDWRQLCILISRINSRPLAMERPPWEVYIIEGLDNVEGVPKGSFVLYIKIHQACTEGWNGHAMLAALLDTAPDAVIAPARETWAAEREPSNLELLLRSMPNRVSGPYRQVSRLSKKLPRVGTGLRDMLNSDVDTGAKFNVPDTRFNRTPSAHRVFEATRVPLQDLQTIKRAVNGATINDVVITIVGGAMRRYLQRHGELPEQSLGVTVPVHIADENSNEGSRTVDMLVDMHTDLFDPMECLQAVHHSAVNAKKLAAKFDVGDFVKGEFSNMLTPAMTKSLNRWTGRLHLADKVGAVGANTMIVNQAGPDAPLYHTGARMLNYYGIPALTNMLGLAHMVLSYAGNVTITAYACRDMLPDPEFYIECIRAEYNDCLQAAGKSVNGQKQTLRKKARQTRSKIQPKTPTAAKKAKAVA